MKKLLSLLAILGLLSFLATPIYAQEENVVDETVDAVEDVVDETVDAVEDVVDETADAVDEVVDETANVIDETIDLGEIENFNDIFENEEVQNALGELDLSNEEGAGLIGVIAGLLAGLGIVGGIIGLVLWILRIIALWKAFERAGQGGWEAIVPIYCSYIKYKLAGMKNWFWYALLIALVMGIIAACVPDQKDLITNIATVITGIIYIVMTFKFARKYGWGVFASILYVIFNPICVLILGFGNYPYEGKSDKTVVEA